MGQFKIGDYAKCIDNDNSKLPICVGAIYKVSDILVAYDKDLVMVYDGIDKLDMWIQTMRFEKVTPTCERPSIVKRNGPVLVYVTGGKGCGKTYMVNELCNRLVEMGLVVDSVTGIHHVTKDAKRLEKSIGGCDLDVIVIDDVRCTPEDTPTVTTANPNTTFDQLCDRIKTLHAQKGTTYTKNVIEELPVDMWLSQVVIKATRAKYAVKDAKRVDELFDTAVYCLMTLEEMARQGVDMSPIMGVGDK